VPHRIGDHAVDLGGLRKPVDAVQPPQRLRADLSGGGPLHGRRSGVSIEAGEGGGKNARREAGLAHGQNDHGDARVGAGQREDAAAVGRPPGGSDDLVGVGRHAGHPLQDLIQVRSALVVVVGDDQLGVLAQLLQAVGGKLGRLDLDVHGLRAGGGARFENADLIVDAAVEPAVILMPTASGEDGAARMDRRGSRE